MSPSCSASTTLTVPNRLENQLLPSRRAFLKSGAAAVGVCIARTGHGARASSSYPRLSDRQVTMLVGGGVGGGYDLCGRILAQHFEKLVPGLRIDIKNVTQASGRLAGKMLQEGPADGSMLGTAGPTLLAGQLLGEESVAYDLRQWGWLGKVAEETNLLVKGPGADFANLAELKAKQTSSPMSVSSISATPTHNVLWLNAMLGLHIKPVPGYKSMEKDAAMMQGEVMLTSATWPTDRRVLESNGVDVILRLSSGEVPEKYRDRPLLADLVSDHPSYLPIVKYIETTAKLQRWFATPPNTDPLILADWRNLFDAVTASPDFRADLGKVDFAGEPMNGAKISEIIEAVLADQKHLGALLQDTLKCGQAMADGLAGPCTHS